MGYGSGGSARDRPVLTTSLNPVYFREEYPQELLQCAYVERRGRDRHMRRNAERRDPKARGRPRQDVRSRLEYFEKKRAMGCARRRAQVKRTLDNHDVGLREPTTTDYLTYM